MGWSVEADPVEVSAQGLSVNNRLRGLLTLPLPGPAGIVNLTLFVSDATPGADAVPVREPPTWEPASALL